MKQLNEDILEAIQNINDDIISKNDLINEDFDFYMYGNINERIAYLVNKCWVDKVYTTEKVNLNLSGLAKKFTETFRNKSMFIENNQVEVSFHSNIGDDLLSSVALSQALGIELNYVGRILHQTSQNVREIYISENGVIYYVDNLPDAIGIFANNIQDFFIKIFKIPVRFDTRLTTESSENLEDFFEVLDKFENEKIKAFTVFEYAYLNEEINPAFTSLIEYLERNPLKISSDEVFVSGRVLETEIKLGDILLSENTKIISKIKSIEAYGKEVYSMSPAMTCGITLDKSFCGFKDGEILYTIKSSGYL